MRLNGSTLEQLDQRARELGITRTALADRYIEEGLRMDKHPGIVFWQRPAGRDAMLAGTRLSVRNIVEVFLDNDGSVEATAEYLDKRRHLIEVVIGYYAEYKDEVDAWIEEERRFAEREEEAWRRQRELLG
jgi:hypothetical protein